MFNRIYKTFTFCVPILLVFLLFGCNKSLPKLDDLDREAWKGDRNACGTYRIIASTSLIAQKEKLLALKEMQIVELLGRPDRNELYRRNQKFYYYYLKPAPDCANYDASNSARLAIRFNAMGRQQFQGFRKNKKGQPLGLSFL
jgi:outer membrane protein assembly factor BamE (lipoprotein component of BamABCDE complex)